MFMRSELIILFKSKSQKFGLQQIEASSIWGIA